ncbi:hypothetical protein HNR74_004303 [Flammeovirga kamogawensis]|nr:hypothetical protein [Flammeovirga kamogawensis]
MTYFEHYSFIKYMVTILVIPLYKERIFYNY